MMAELAAQALAIKRIEWSCSWKAAARLLAAVYDGAIHFIWLGFIGVLLP